MKSRSRIDTVLRVRELQARMAEIETVDRRRESAQRRSEKAAAVAVLQERLAGRIGHVTSVESLRATADVGRVAAEDVELRGDLLAMAEASTRDAEAAWLRAHRRQDAIERLAERHEVAARVELVRTEQKELDELVSVRHGRHGGPA